MAEETGVVAQSPGKLLEIAIQKDLDIEKLGKLMDLQERWDAQQAKKAYYEALSKFQRIVPVLEKKNTVDFVSKKTGGQTHYTYASLSDIGGQIKESLSDCGMSYRWEIADKEGEIEVTCIVTHLSGHSEKTTMVAPADVSGQKNPVQERASTITYLQRYTLIGALGLTTANLDDDGRQGSTEEYEKPPTKPRISPKKSELKDELIDLLKCPGLTDEIIMPMEGAIKEKKITTAKWYRDQIRLVKALIADMEK